MGNMRKKLRGARKAVLRTALVLALAAGMMPAAAFAQTEEARPMSEGVQIDAAAQVRAGGDGDASAGTVSQSDQASVSVGSAPVQEGLQDGDTISTNVAVAVWSSFRVTTEPSYVEFRSKALLLGDDRYLVSTFEGGSRIDGAADGIPYEYEWARERWDKDAKVFVAEAPGPGTFTASVTCEATDDGMVMRYDLKADEFAADTRYRYTLTARDGAGLEQVNQVEVFCGNRYIFDPIENGTTKDNRTVVTVSAMRLWDSYLGVEELGPEVRNELYPLVGGYVMDSASNVSLSSDTATEEEPAYVVPPEVALTIRLNDQSVAEGTPVRVVSVQGGRAVVVSEPDARVEVLNGYKVAYVGHASANMAEQTGVEELGIFAVAYAPAGGADEQLRVTSQVGLDAGQSAPEGAVVPADAGQVYASGQTVRYTFLPEVGCEIRRVTVGPNADGAANPEVGPDTPGCALGLNFLDYTVPTPAEAGAAHMYVTVFYVPSEMPGPVDPSNPDDPDDPLNRGYAVTAMAPGDPSYDGRGSVRIVGAGEGDVDEAGNPRVYVKPTESATIEFMPDANSVLARVTVQEAGGEPREASVIGSRLVLASVGADTVVRAYFKYGAYIPRTELDVAYSQNVEPAECGWQLGGSADSVFYGDPLTVMVERVGDAADDWELKALTVNGEDVLARAQGAAEQARASAGGGAVSYLVDYVVRDTAVAATFEKRAGSGPDDPSKPVDPDDPNKPTDPSNPDDPNNPNNPGNPGDGNGNGNGSGDGNGSGNGSGDLSNQTFTVKAASNGHGVIQPSGTLTVRGGTPLAFTLKPEIGYRPARLTIQDAAGTRTIAHTATSYTHKVTGDCTITVSFAAQAVPASDSQAARTIRRLTSLAQTGDLNLPIALALVGTAAAAAGVLLLTRRRREESTAPDAD